MRCFSLGMCLIKYTIFIMNDYKRIIFLDIDGVLASIPYLCSGKGFVDPEKCKLLNQLEDLGVEVVISSSTPLKKDLRTSGSTTSRRLSVQENPTISSFNIWNPTIPQTSQTF